MIPLIRAQVGRLLLAARPLLGLACAFAAGVPAAPAQAAPAQAAPAQAAAADPAAGIEALVARAAAHIRSAGRTRAFADFSRPDAGFGDGETYVFCDAADGTVLANGGNPKLVGRNLVSLRDATGRTPVAEMIGLGLTHGSGWLEYLWPDPRLGRIKPKMVYVLRIDEMTICGSGYYKSDPP